MCLVKYTVPFENFVKRTFYNKIRVDTFRKRFCIEFYIINIIKLYSEKEKINIKDIDEIFYEYDDIDLKFLFTFIYSLDYIIELNKSCYFFCFKQY